jgi:hypothetical protein
MNLDQCKEKLGEELSRLLNEGAKVYLVDNMRIGKVFKVAEQIVRIDAGSKAEPMPIMFEMADFYHSVMNDKIVALSRVSFDEDGKFTGVKPRATPLPERVTVPSKTVGELNVKINTDVSVQKSPSLTEIGFINEKTGKFSLERKRGYTEIRFDRVKRKVELELDESQVEKLREMGLL